MEGQSDIDSSDPKTGAPHRNGTLAWMIFNETRPDVTAWSKRLWDPSTNNYLVREDVWVYGNENVGTGNWTVGNGFLPKKNGPEYGFGYAFLPYAPPDGPPMLAFGPGHFACAVKSVAMRVMDDGEVRLRAAFVVNRPDRITSVDIDPVGWGLSAADRLTLGRASRLTSAMRSMAGRLPFRMSKVDPLVAFISASNSLTGGMAGRRLGISMETLEKRMLMQHFMQHHAMFMTSMRAWRAVPDWTDPTQVPEAHREAVVA